MILNLHRNVLTLKSKPKLSTLPDIPDGTVELNFRYNNITSIPPLPASLRKLNCSQNKLKSLPDLPPQLEELDCGDNNLTSLPPLPDTLIVLDCGDNPLKSVPKLPPNLKFFSAFNSRLTYIPEMPESLEHIHLEYIPLEEPFLTFRNNYYLDGRYDYANAFDNLKKVVNSYYANKRHETNLTTLTKTTQTVGLPFPEDVEAHIGSFLTGETGTIKQQKIKLKEKLSRIPGAPGASRKRRKSRKLRKANRK
jgi:Leucine-rich repeat (LRR) protein